MNNTQITNHTKIHVIKDIVDRNNSLTDTMVKVDKFKEKYGIDVIILYIIDRIVGQYKVYTFMNDEWIMIDTGDLI